MKTVLVTGASTGLGLALSELLIEATDFHLVLTAREKSLGRFAQKGIIENERVWIRPLDVTMTSEREDRVKEINDLLGGVDILINNAGIACRAVVEHVTEPERLAQMDINFRSPMELARLVLPSMRAKRAGKIINISSRGAIRAFQGGGVYSASKAGLQLLTQPMALEFGPHNIQANCLAPTSTNPATGAMAWPAM